MSTHPQSNDSSRKALPAASELPHDAAAAPREHFIPIRKSDLAALLAEDASLSDQERTGFLDLCKLVGSSIHVDYHRKLEEIKDAYAPLDPDMDEQPREKLTADEVNNRGQEVFAKFGHLMERANFRKLSDHEIRGALKSTSDWGLNLQLDFSIFERLEVFARGDVVGRKTISRWQDFYRKRTIDVPTYQRLAVIFRLKEAHKVAAGKHTPGSQQQGLAPAPKRPIALKLFKNIPKADLEMLLPGTRVKMTLFDQGRIWLPTVSGIGLALFKMVAKGAALLALASFSGMVAFLALLIGTIGYGVKAFFGYLRTKDKYQLNLTRSLYFQNLDNNAGVFFRLLDEAEEQEFREAIIAYWLLWRDGGDGGWTVRQIDEEAEQFIRERCRFEVDFEIDDALDKLCTMRLVEKLPGEKWRAIPLQAALAELDRAWDNIFAFPSPAETAAGQLTPASLPMKQVLRRLQAA